MTPSPWAAFLALEAKALLLCSMDDLAAPAEPAASLTTTLDRLTCL